MRLISQIMTLFVAISAIVTPCLGKFPTANVGVPTDMAVGREVVVELAAGERGCKGSCLKTMVARQQEPGPGIVVVHDIDKFVPVLTRKAPVEGVAQTCILPPPKRPNPFAVDLFMLCRQLN